MKPHVVKWEPHATDAIQKALDGGGEIVIPYAEPYVVDPLFVRLSGTKLQLEPGVVLLARRDGFRGVGDCLIRIDDLKDVTIWADGATIRGWRMELTNADKVPHSEWRHGLRVKRSKRVRVNGLTVEKFGGDGVYLNDVFDFQMSRVTCRDNYRNGLTIISGRVVLATDCRFNSTGGHHPQAGVCLEPNETTDELFGIMFRRCSSEGNNGPGFFGYFQNLSPTSSRVMVHFLDCTSRRNRTATPIVAAPYGLPPKSKIDFQRCTFWDERWRDEQDIATYRDCNWITTTQTVEHSDG